MSKLSENFGKRFIVTGEIAPPRGPDLTDFYEEIEIYKPLMKKLDGINVVDIPGSLLLLSSLGAAIVLQQHRLEPVFQMVTRDRNVLALEADLISASAFDIENVLALTGDHPKVRSGDHPNARPVFELDSSSLIKTIIGMNKGFDITARKLNKSTNFFIGAALAPGVNPLEPEIYKTKRKLNAGADFFQTQAIFEPKLMENFLRKYKRLLGEDIRKRISMSIVPLYDWGMVKFLRTMPGVVISEETGKRIKNAKDPVEEGTNIASELIDCAKEIGMAGVHLMPAGKIEILVKLIESL